MADERAISVSVNYILSLVIVTMIISGLFIGMNGFVQTERKNTVRSEFDVLSNRLTADLAAADRLAQTTSGPTASVEVYTEIPQQVAGVGYEIEITATDAGDYYDVTIRLTSNRFGIERVAEVRTANEVVDTTVSGGPYVITFDGSTLEVDND